MLAWVKTGIAAKSFTQRELKRLEFKVGPVPAGLPDFESFGLGNLAMSERMVPLLELIWVAASKEFAPKVGLDPDDFRVDNPRIADAVEAAALAFAGSTNETTSLELHDAIERTRKLILEGNRGTGLSYEDLTRAINEVFDRANQSRARRIAVTESARAVHAARELIAIESRVVRGWRWLLSSDACPLCQTIARRARFVPIGQPFAVIGTNPDYSEVRHPPAHPYCQCSMVEVLDTDPDVEWSPTLVQPVPGPEDSTPDERPAP